MPRINPYYRQEAREKIIAIALEIAVEHGWEKVTLDAISRNVGTTKPALYNYFRNRDLLLRDVLFEVFRNFRSKLEVALSPDNDLHGNIQNLSNILFEKKEAHTNLFFQIPLNLLHDNESGEEFVRIVETSRNIIRDCLIRAHLRGQLSRDVDPDITAKALMVLIFGLHVSSPFMRMDKETKKVVWAISVERLMRFGAV